MFGCRDVGRDINFFVLLVIIVNSIGIEKLDVICKLYLLIIENLEKSKSGNYIL